MPLVFSERLLPATTTYLALMLSSPMVLLAALPFGLELAITLGTLVPLTLAITITALAPKIELTETELLAGRFRIPINVIGQVKALDQAESRFERGPGLNANAKLLLRGDIPELIKIQIVDSEDPTPYVLVSTRRGKQLARALGADRT